MRSLVIGTAGHIDHGKSTLVRALTGTDPDRLKEERERGITIDLGFASTEIDGATIAFVDVPGHERFVKNMLAGTGGIDAVVLVVAADESVMPQTREHFHICRLLKVPAGLVALTKADAADREMIELATMEVRELVDGSFLDGAPILPVSSRTGQGLDAFRDALGSLATALPIRQTGGPVRLPIDRAFSMKGFGTVVTGTLVSGRLETDQELEILPSRHRVSVRGLHVHGRRAASVDAGSRAAVNLGGVEVADVVRGQTLCAVEAFEPTKRVDAAIELLASAPALRHGARVRFHAGTTELLGRIALATTERGARIYARLHLESPAVVTRGDRFILRSYSPLDTIGGGVVLDPAPPRAAIRTPAGQARLRRIDTETSALDEALAWFVEERGPAGLPVHALVSRAGLPEPDARAAVTRLTAAKKAVAIGTLLVAPEILTALGKRLIAELEAHHTANPLSDGMPREEAREKIFRRAEPAVFEHVIERLTSERKLAGRDRLAIEGRQVSLSGEEARVQDALERVYRDARLTPPDLTAAAAAAGASVAVADRVAGLLLRRRTLIKIESLLFHATALDQLKTDVRGLKQEGGTARVDVASFKERYGITRKFAIPLLEYLDRERVTRRVGDARVVL